MAAPVSDSPRGRGERPLRIAFLDSWFTDPVRGSGSAMAIRGLREGLERAGHHVRVLRPDDRGGPGVLPAGSIPRRLGYNVALRSRLDPSAWDLLVGFDVDGFLLPDFPRLPRIVCLKGVAADELRFESGSVRLRLRALAMLESRNARTASGVVVPSRYSRRRVTDLYRVPAGRVAVVPEGIDAGRWTAGRSAPRPPAAVRPPGATPPPAGAGRPESRPPTVLSVARQYRRKNTRDLLIAFRRLLHRVPDARLRVVGGGPELPALRELHARLGLGDSARLLGDVADRAEVAREYAGADVFCLPSLQEGFGIAYLEAMASGLPLVAYRAGAAPEVVPHGRAGLLCPPGDREALAAALHELVTDPERRGAMAEEGRSRAQRYDWPRVAGVFLEAVESLTGRTVRSARRRAGDGAPRHDPSASAYGL